MRWWVKGILFMPQEQPKFTYFYGPIDGKISDLIFCVNDDILLLMKYKNQFKRFQYCNPTLVSAPWNELISFFTKSFIFLKSDDDTLPEPSNRNAMSAWLRHTVKKEEMVTVMEVSLWNCLFHFVCVSWLLILTNHHSPQAVILQHTWCSNLMNMQVGSMMCKYYCFTFLLHNFNSASKIMQDPTHLPSGEDGTGPSGLFKRSIIMHRPLYMVILVQSFGIVGPHA